MKLGVISTALDSNTLRHELDSKFYHVYTFFTFVPFVFRMITVKHLILTVIFKAASVLCGKYTQQVHIQ